MTTPAASPTVLDLSNSYGQAFIATIIATMFWGIASMQIWRYFMTYESDRWFLKSLVITLWLLNTGHEVICAKGLLEVLARKFGNIKGVSKSFQLEFVWQFGVMSVVAAIAQGFFTWRISCFIKSKLLLLILIPLILVQLLLSFANVLSTSHLNIILTSFSHEFLFSGDAVAVVVLSVNIVSTVTDVFIAITMSIALRRRRTGFKSTDRMISRLITISASTGAGTAVFAVIGFLTALLKPRVGFLFLGQIPLCSLYCNAVLANLNSRKYLRGPEGAIDALSTTTGPSIRIRAFSSSLSARRVSGSSMGME